MATIRIKYSEIAEWFVHILYEFARNKDNKDFFSTLFRLGPLRKIYQENRPKFQAKYKVFETAIQNGQQITTVYIPDDKETEDDFKSLINFPLRIFKKVQKFFNATDFSEIERELDILNEKKQNKNLAEKYLK
jgi:hypothetical protein